ncbi:MAG TPA: four helix bundle protein [Candidatus Omnitrophica bacterium]|nr:four helix bundle protein [Candidatus Omnitrophota bacterium]
MAKFRFQDLQIWKFSIEIAEELFDIADDLESKKLFRFAEQLRGAAMSVPNNIAEGSGSESGRDFSNFLNIARRSIFENANILIILNKRGLVSEKQLNKGLEGLDYLGRQVTNFKRTLRK